MEPSSILPYLLKALKIKSILSDLIESGKKGHNYYKQKRDTLKFDSDLDSVFSTFQAGKIRYGSFIEGKVFLSRFSHTYIPQTFMPSIATSANYKEEYPSFIKYLPESRTGYSMIPKKARTSWKTRSFLPPLESLPELNVSGVPSKIGFIYPIKFNGFGYTQNKEKLKGVAPDNALSVFDIRNEQKPIPIIYPIDTFNDSECLVHLKAKVIGLPEELTNKLFSNNPLFNAIFSKIYFPFKASEKILCLSASSKDLQIKKLKDRKFDKIKGPLFIEAHLENFKLDDIGKNKFNKMLNESVPFLVEGKLKSFSYRNFEEYHAFLTSEDVSFIYKEPNFFGFYCDSNFVTNFKEDIKKMQKFLILFKNNLIERLDKFGIKTQLKIDFVSDYYTQKIFDKEGVLSSSEVLEITKKQKDLEKTRKWLKLEE